MRMAVVGLGRAGRVHAAAGRAEPSVEVVAGCDPSAAARDAVRPELSHVYAGLGPMLAGERLDGAVVCTPPSDHGALAMTCLAKGLHVLCEKPLAIGVGEAQRMFRVAATHGRMLVVASKFRQLDAVRATRELLRDGAIGEPLTFSVSFCASTDMTRGWQAQQRLSGGGVIADNGGHVFDLVSYLFGAVTRVHASRLRSFQALAVEDSACLRLDAGGVIGNADLSWSWTRCDDRYLTVQGSEGTIEVGWQESRVRRNGGGGQRIGGPYDKLAAHRRMHAQFAACAAGSAVPWIDREQCLLSVAGVEAAYRSLASGAWERVDVSAPLVATRLRQSAVQAAR